MKPLTYRQAQLLALLRTGYARCRPFSQRELCDAMGISSTNGIAEHLRALERKGLVRHRPGLSRLAWEPVEDRGDPPPGTRVEPSVVGARVRFEDDGQTVATGPDRATAIARAWEARDRDLRRWRVADP